MALAVTLIAILVIGVLAAAGYGMANVELDTSRDYRAATEAFYVADRGMNRYLAEDADSLPSPVSYDFPEGSATVTVERVTWNMQYEEELHRVRSTGTYEAPDGESVTRTVSNVLLATPLLPIFPSGALVSSTTVEQEGGPSSQFDGVDAYTGGDAKCDAADIDGDVTGIVADSFQVSGGGSGGGRCESGANVSPDPPGPECRSDATDEFMSAEQWSTIKNWEADHTISGGDPFPSTDGWEIVKIEGDSYNRDSGSKSGKGILIVENDFTSNGNFTWDGIILAGGSVSASNGTQTVNGAVITGLNELLGEDVSGYSLGNGTKKYLYNSCNVYRASITNYRVSRVPASWYEKR